MSEILFGVICFAGGVVTAVLVPRVFAFAQRAIAKGKAAVDQDDGKE
jgi:hypothetical protein